MISEEKLKRYAINFLKSEINKIHEALEVIQDDVERDGEARLLTDLARDYKCDLVEIESSLEGC